MTTKRVRVVLDEAAVTSLTTLLDRLAAFLERQRWRQDKAAGVANLQKQLEFESYCLNKRLGDAKGDGDDGR